MIKNIRATKTKMVLLIVEVAVLGFLLSGCSRKIDGKFSCGGDIVTFAGNGTVTTSSGIRPMKYKVEGDYIFVTTPANESAPLYKKNGDKIALNMEGSGFPDAVCEEIKN